MGATVKKVKATPKPAKKSRQAPVATQKKKVVRLKKVAEAMPVEEAAPIAVAAVAEKVMATPQASSDNRILLPARMEMSSLDEAHELLQNNYPPVHARYILDGALMNVIDMAGIQMLISFIRSMTAKGCKVEWDNYSVQMYQLASELGVTSQLGD